MREGGLERAVEAAGGVSALARALGVSQPTVSNWERVPAERALAVEAATGVSRSVLRPDLYPPEPDESLDEVEAARAAQYRLLSALLASDPKAGLLAQVARLRGDASPLGMANAALAEAAASARVDDVEAEYFDLFIGVGRGETMPFGSYYLAGFVYDRPLARLRADLAQIGVERAGHGDPEDHVAFVLEAMAGMIDGTFPASAQTQRDFFERHVASWAPRFLADLGVTPRAAFYRHVAQAAAVFLDIETQAFALDDATTPSAPIHDPQA
jgi:TorA maturation chaperone TorD